MMAWVSCLRSWITCTAAQLSAVSVTTRRALSEGLPPQVLLRQRHDQPHQLQSLPSGSRSHPVGRRAGLYDQRRSWFRPVDIQLGADGALYVADFYNKIIGHYEVRLDHPERDRTSGRIWRIVYRGNDATSKPLTNLKMPAWENKSTVIEELGSANGTRRDFALQQLNRSGDQARAESIINQLNIDSSNDQQSIAALWAGFIAAW